MTIDGKVMAILHDAREQRDAAYAALRRIAAHVGASVAEDCSHDFHLAVAEEVRAVVDALKARLAEAESAKSWAGAAVLAERAKEIADLKARLADELFKIANYKQEMWANMNRANEERDTTLAAKEKAERALSAINDIRNSIIGTQAVNWSAHIYPLVKLLNEAGIAGQGYEEARDKAQTLIEQRDAAVAAKEKAVRERDAERSKRITAVHYAREIAGHAETCGIVSTPAYELAVARTLTIREQDTPLPALMQERDALKAECERWKAQSAGPITQRDREVWRAAITLANNACVQISDRANAEDGPTDVIQTAAECAKRIRTFIEIDDGYAAELSAALQAALPAKGE